MGRPDKRIGQQPAGTVERVAPDAGAIVLSSGIHMIAERG